MANTSPRPTIGGTTGLVTYVDFAGNLYPAIVNADFAALSGGSGNSGALDLEFISTNPAAIFSPQDETQIARGRLPVHVNNVPDQGNAGVITACSTTAGSGTVTITGSTTGIPASGYVTGAGIIPTQTIANPLYNNLSSPDVPQTLLVGSAYTLSGSTVTLLGGLTALVTGTGENLFFSATPMNYWRYPTAYTI